MRGDWASIELLRPGSPAEALEMAASHPDARPLAGGTDLMTAFNAGVLNGIKVLDLSRMEAWRGVEVQGGVARIGSLATHAMIESHPVLLRRLPLLCRACASVGSVQIRNRGTLGGNVANASPAADTLPALAVYEAFVNASSKAGRRSLPLPEMIRGVKKTRLAPGELIESLCVPFPKRPPTRQMFRKVGSRRAQTISKTVGAGLLWLGEGGEVSGVRLAFGSVAPTVRRLSSVEAFLAGRRLTPENIEQACGLLDSDISPIDDLRSTRSYRMRVSRNILRAFLSR
jgi:CO/xanthine dehydrogenase FAD-binding subunit